MYCSSVNGFPAGVILSQAGIQCCGKCTCFRRRDERKVNIAGVRATRNLYSPLSHWERVLIMSEEKQISVTLEQQSDYRFLASYDDGAPALITDEPAPLGQGQGPSPVQLLTTAVGNCLTDSLLFALRKFKQEAEPLRTQVTAKVGRNEKGRMRVLEIEAHIRLGTALMHLSNAERVLGQFEGFCTVTQSVAQGLPIKLSVFDSTGALLHYSDSSEDGE
ncbi:conserved hypothetical protein [gamma proteobacterium HdN1]|nr:conserved hypothetical protein [gamma proteobacterium HdN1]